MTRKDYKAIAAEIAALESATDRRRLAVALAEILSKTNPAFNRGRFIAACDALA